MTVRVEPDRDLGMQGHYAGIVTRLAAFAIDVLLSASLYTLGGNVFEYLFTSLGKELTLSDRPGVSIAVLTLWLLLYFAYPIAVGGRTPGMALVGLEVVTKDGGDVTILPQENSVTLTSFQENQIDGAWVPEPWATRLVQEGGGEILLDEASLWPDGKYTTTVLVVTSEFLEKNPEVVQNLIAANDAAIQVVTDDPAAAKASISKGIGDVTDKPMPEELITKSFESVKFGLDPVFSSLQKSADDAAALGFIENSDIANLWDPTYVNKVLADNDQPALT